MKMLLNRLFPLLISISSLQLQSCGQTDSSKSNVISNQIHKQRIDYADSLLVIKTLKEWSNLNWWTFQDCSLEYKMTNESVEYFVERVFYDSEKKKMMVWYGEKTPNAKTIESYSDDERMNRMCPTGGDTVYFMSALIGFRESAHQIWNLYPFENQSVACSPNRETAVNIMEQYYFAKMKDHPMWRIIQEGNKKGESELKAYDYNIQDEDFWSKCWLWEKDTIGAKGLYPFQVERYTNTKGQKCNYCAKPFDVPKIKYPEEILKLYK